MGYLPSYVVSILLYGCTTWMLTKRVQKKLDGATIEQILKETPHKITVIRPLTPISQIIQVRQTRHVRHNWRQKQEFICYPKTWMRKSWSTCKNPLYLSSKRSLEDLLGARTIEMDRKRENQENDDDMFEGG